MGASASAASRNRSTAALNVAEREAATVAETSALSQSRVIASYKGPTAYPDPGKWNVSRAPAPVSVTGRVLRAPPPVARY